ncbi:adenylyl-sulfate kinase [Pseudomonas viridiflava]|uniref:adenylyl-sulfate kinase n=1 Tax=Pseudomonas viridiflava TaxID=33069 RepID=UPI000F017E2F|nr:adenylyl-sulfate kinase [Pseudomonas viridiflava]QXG35052.1 adenylyl-sulfate kinase [Pseudomonas viridiflava]QXG43270.1 adenylyl-sulfate kinase [Pseudomonas viridiflava]
MKIQQAISLSSKGFVILFTGLSGAGKSSIAQALSDYLQLRLNKPVTLLDGDLVRAEFCAELDFSREGRAINVTRVAYIASEIVKHNGIVLCALIAPYADSRSAMRDKVSQNGCFFEIHVNTPIDICEARDVKGLYAKARAGAIHSFTGVSDSYEPPKEPDLILDGSHGAPSQLALKVIDFLMEKRILCNS